MQNDRGKINEQPLGRWAARAVFPDGETLDIIATQTTQPDIYRHGLERTYITAIIQFWEVDAHGNPIGEGPEAIKRTPTEKANGPVRVKAEGERQERAKRPPGMGELFRT